jgi:hypothetical protein
MIDKKSTFKGHVTTRDMCRSFNVKQMRKPVHKKIRRNVGKKEIMKSYKR